MPPFETLPIKTAALNRRGQCKSPIVLDSPHSGTNYPDDFLPSVPMAQLRQAEDTHVDKLFSFAPDLGVPLVEATFPRSYIDANRASDEIDPLLFDGDWTSFYTVSAKTSLGKGLVWRMLDDGTPIYQRLLSRQDLDHRLEQYWQPYHQAVKQMISDAYAQFGFVLHINCHSMPSVAGEYGTDQPGLEHPDIVLGDRDGTTANPLITQFMQKQFIALGYQCWVNRPYKGVELVRAYSEPSVQRHSIQLEVNRNLYMDEKTLVVHDGFFRLQKDLQFILINLQALCRSLRLTASASSPA